MVDIIASHEVEKGGGEYFICVFRAVIFCEGGVYLCDSLFDKILARVRWVGPMGEIVHMGIKLKYQGIGG